MKSQCQRWKAVFLAGALAVSGILFLIHQLGPAVIGSGFAGHPLVQFGPVLLAFVAFGLGSAAQTGSDWRSTGARKKGQTYGR